MIWGTVEAADGNMHVVPCDEDGDITHGHLVQVYCPCGPKVEKHPRCLLVIHEQDVLEQFETLH